MVGLKVADLIDHENAQWRWDVLAANFSDDDIGSILSIPLSARMPQDVRIWCPDREGFFTVKSAYWLGCCGHLDGWFESLNGMSEDSWGWIWKMKAPPKVLVFAWRLMTGSLAVRARLVHRHIIESGICPCCDIAEETVLHAVMDCPSADLAWEGSVIGLRIRGRLFSSPDDVVKDVFASDGAKGLLEFFTHAWISWTARNHFLFQDEPPNVQVLRIGFLKLVADYQNVWEARHDSMNKSKRAVGAECWCKPPIGFIKINVDAACVVEGAVWLGAVARDDSGQMLWAAVRRVEARWCTQVAEASAALLGLRVAKERGHTHIVLELDALLCVQAITGGDVELSYFGLITEDIRCISSSFSTFKCEHVRRSGNTVAHHVARQLPPDGISHVFADQFPSGLVDLAALDLI